MTVDRCAAILVGTQHESTIGLGTVPVRSGCKGQVAWKLFPTPICLSEPLQAGDGSRSAVARLLPMNWDLRYCGCDASRAMILPDLCATLENTFRVQCRQSH